MRELIEYIAKALVDEPDDVRVAEVEGERVTVIELRVAQTDLGKVFTIFYVLAGISVILAFANAVLQGAAARERERLERRATRSIPPERET